MKEMPDNELFDLITQSSYPAFSELYQRHWKYIYSIAYRKTLDKDDSFDLTQNVFMEFYDKREVLVINIPVRNFLRTAMIYKLSHYFRTKGFQEKHYQNFKQFLEQAQESDVTYDTLATRETEMAFEEMVALVYHVIEEMPEKMKEVFLMSRSEHYSVVEIAKKLNLSPQTVKNQVSKAFIRIRSAAGHHEFSAMLCLWLIHS